MKMTQLSVLILVVGLVAGACSGSGDVKDVASLDAGTSEPAEDTDPDSSTDSATDSEEAMLAFTRCLREQGLDVDDPTIDADGNMQLPPISFTSVGDGSDPEQGFAEFEKLIAPCEEHLDGIVTTAGPGTPTGVEDSFLAYAQCMRSNGIDMPDPDFSSNGGMIDLGSAGGEEFDAADKECRPLLGDLGIPQE